MCSTFSVFHTLWTNLHEEVAQNTQLKIWELEIYSSIYVCSDLAFVTESITIMSLCLEVFTLVSIKLVTAHLWNTSD